MLQNYHKIGTGYMVMFSSEKLKYLHHCLLTTQKFLPGCITFVVTVFNGI